jgi:hypothetical protein
MKTIKIEISLLEEIKEAIRKNLVKYNVKDEISLYEVYKKI